jgi:methyltransferase (TIGR00027 family)
MKLPNLSYMMTVGELRYIQARFEKGSRQNPDKAVGAFLPLWTRIVCTIRGLLLLHKVRAQRFYDYVNARTRYYDDIFLAAARGSFRSIVNVGCGSDTRAHRFGDVIKAQGLKILECDQAEAIRTRERLAKRKWPEDAIQYLALDLEDGQWPKLQAFLTANREGRTLVMMEGVSPYVGENAFRTFLVFLAQGLLPGSVVAYDFKLRGVADDFGDRPQAEKRFRLPAERDEVQSYHQALGFDLAQFDLSADLSRMFQPDAEQFEEDGLVKLEVRARNPGGKNPEEKNPGEKKGG